MTRPEIVLQARPACLGHSVHHAVGADRDDPVDGIERDLDRTERARPVGLDPLHDIADKGKVLRTPGCEAGWLVAAPDDLVGGALDVFDPVAVGNGLVASDVKHP